MAFKKKLITVDGRKVFYWEKNHEKKETVVLLHGFPGSHEGLIDVANGLKNYRMIIPDLPACGLSEPLKEKHNLENYSKWLNDFLKFLSINRAIIIGHSFGSRVSLVFSNRYPEKVERLVLITPVLRVDGLIVRFASIEYKIAKILPQHLRKAWLYNKVYRKVGSIILFKSASPKRRHKLIAMENRELKYLDPRISIELFDEFYKIDLVPVGEKIKNKSLVIACDLDEIAPLNSVRELAKQLTNSDFIIMKGCGHLVVGEKPLTTATTIRNWLERHTGD